MTRGDLRTDTGRGIGCPRTVTPPLMQTFLPFADFAESAEILDDRRLGKQRVEVLQILRALTRAAYGWKHHPAVRMWLGHTEALASYGIAMCQEWACRGRPDTCGTLIIADLSPTGRRSPRRQDELALAGLLPCWLGDERVHASHRAALVRKDPARYGPLFPDADAALPYHWPVA